MNTHESYVSLETARLLKQAGFDWECWYYFDLWGRLFDEEGNECAKRYQTYKNASGEMVAKNFNKSESFASAPTLAVAQRWVREVKGIFIDPIRQDFSMNPEEIWSWEIYIPNGEYLFSEPLYDAYTGYREQKDYSFHTTYEAALEAGIQKCLTLILEKK